MPYIKEERPETLSVEGEWDIGATTWKANRLMEEFVKGLKQKKLIGSLCLGCGKVIVPPRNICGRCHRRMEGRVVVSDRGTVTCFTYTPPVGKGKYKVMGMDPVEMGLIQEGEVLVPVFVRFDGSDSNMNLPLIGVDPKEVYVGMRVRIVWAKEPKGELSDIEGVEPIK
jgi:uncharacterized OB-fold protein